MKQKYYFVTSSLRVWVVAKPLYRKVILETTFLKSSCEHSIKHKTLRTINPRAEAEIQEVIWCALPAVSILEIQSF